MIEQAYRRCIQYDSIEAGIQANAEIYSFNIESNLFNQLTKEQQELWRKEIEQAYISGGETGVELARDIRYKENLDVDLNPFFEKLGVEPNSRIAYTLKETFYKGIDRYLNKKENNPYKE